MNHNIPEVYALPAVRQLFALYFDERIRIFLFHLVKLVETLAEVLKARTCQ